MRNRRRRKRKRKGRILCLAIETSCDDTSVALVHETGFVHSCLSRGQDAFHAPFGGIVPKIACRNHTYQLLPLIEELFAKSQITKDAIDGIAVTSRPGLIGSLIVGVVTAKSLAISWNKPWISVNHLEGHLLAPFLKDETYTAGFSWDEPYLALAVSGGHSTIYWVEGLGRYRILGATLDDAAGEAFDKFGKMIGLEFPGGVQVDRLSEGGDVAKFQFPRGLANDETLNMSFSGLKSAAHRILTPMTPEQLRVDKRDLCASFQEAVVDALMNKLELAVQQTGAKRFVVTGGVSANRRLRAKVEAFAIKKKIHLAIPPIRYCTDNAAMIGLAGVLKLKAGETSPWSEAPSPSSKASDFIV